MSTYLIPRPTSVARRPAACASRRTLGLVPAVLAAPAVDVSRDGEDGLVTVEAPGLDPAADLSVAVTGARLTVAGVRRSTAGGVARETRFSRTPALPEGVGQDAVSTGHTAGVLRVRVAGMFPTPVAPATHTVAVTSDVPPRSEAAVGAPTADQPAEVEPASVDERSSGSDDARAEAPAAA